MLVLGISGGLSTLYGGGLYSEAHDAAAVLLEDGSFRAGIEEERLLRVKHSGHLPAHAMRYCLQQRKAQASDLDAIAVFATEESAARIVRDNLLVHPQLRLAANPRALLSDVLSRALRAEVPPDKLCFVDHHTTHAYSTYYLSGFERALVYTSDGAGDGVSSRTFSVQGDDWELLDSVSIPNSLGNLYLETIKYLGYGIHEEYKVMGLAPYGDPSRYRSLFGRCYELLEDGKFAVHPERLPCLLELGAPRRRGDEFTETHRDLAATLQEALERLVRHALEYHRAKTGHTNLCLSGGVCQNSTNNGKLYYSRLFERMFVDPAAYDAGCAVGAAIYAHKQLSPGTRIQPLKTVYWGTAPGDDVARVLAAWSPLIKFEKVEVTGTAAALLADDKVLGWVQGRSEFGPRALGNRSIVADPRPERNKSRINQMIKKREGYRPFAPAVPEEAAADWFDVPHPGVSFATMSYVLNVRPDKRALLGAVTHVDGTARVQTVTAGQNQRFYELLRKFGELTGVPILLNTSFNNNVEPIVESIEDTLSCYLTTGLDHLILGDYLVTRRSDLQAGLMDMTVSLSQVSALREVHRYASPLELSMAHELYHVYRGGAVRPVSVSMFELLKAPGRTLGEFIRDEHLDPLQTETLMSEISSAWSARQVRIEPPR